MKKLTRMSWLLGLWITTKLLLFRSVSLGLAMGTVKVVVIAVLMVPLFRVSIPSVMLIAVGVFVVIVGRTRLRSIR